MIQDFIRPVQFESLRAILLPPSLSVINTTVVYVCCYSAAVCYLIFVDMVLFMCVAFRPILMQPGGSPCNPVNHFAIMYNFCNQHVIELNCYDCRRIMVSALVLRNTSAICVQSKQFVWIVSELPQFHNPVTIVQIANIEVLIAGGLRPPKIACFGDCGALRGLRRTLKHASRSALESGLRPDQQLLG